MTNTLPSAETWASYFSNINTQNVNINEHTAAFIGTSSPSNDRNSKLIEISKDKGDAILLFYCSATKSMKIIHSIEDIGGTTLFPGNLVVALDGFKRNKATPVLIDTNSILTEVEIDAPTFTRIGVITDKESLTALEAPTNNPQKIQNITFCYATTVSLGNHHRHRRQVTSKCFY
jgi:hypothetical protein